MKTSERDLATAGAGALPAMPQHLAHPGAVAPVSFEVDDDGPQHRLPNDHPHWKRDAITISARARALFATLRPVVICVVQFWEHRVREIAIGNRTLSVDPSGSYRLR